MKELTFKSKLTAMVALVRPSLKSMYPLIPMEAYIRWMNQDALPFDPWIRTHYETGASIIKLAEKSMVILASINKWEAWTGMKLPATGSYIIEDGLAPLEIDKSADKGVYIEANVWMKHDLS